MLPAVHLHLWTFQRNAQARQLIQHRRAQLLHGRERQLHLRLDPGYPRNAQARRFYEARGFALVKETDGAANEEKEPDALYLWKR